MAEGGGVATNILLCAASGSVGINETAAQEYPLQIERFFLCPNPNQERNEVTMAITLEANYAKKLGLPNYSSHQYCVTIRTELTDLSQVEAESARLYQLLQSAVDQEIQNVGFMPDATTYGMNNGNGSRANGAATNGARSNGNGVSGQRPARRQHEQWKCTEGQRGFILRLVSDNKLDKNEVEQLSQQLFGIGVTECDKMQASQLIEQLLEKTGKGNGRRPQFCGRQPARA
jgi:hypothetical protein